MIDMHTHILPNVDDGASSLEISYELLKKEKEQGVSTIIFTPHMNELDHDKNKLIQAYNLILPEVKRLGLNSSLGAEIYYYPAMVKDLDNNTLLTLGDTKYILVEFSTRERYNIPDILYDLSLKGYKPILAHIERYYYLTEEEYYSIHKYAKIQVNTGIFTNKLYKKILKILLKNNLIDFIASDCHDLDKRSVDFESVKKILKKYKKEELLTKNTLD